MGVAEIVGARSRCDLRQIGAVIASADNSYVVVGYNGPPAGFDGPPGGLILPAGTTCRSWCPRAAEDAERSLSYSNCVSVHAELNAIAKADRSRIIGGTIYVAAAVCWDCGKVVANSGVSTVVMRVEERDEHRNPARTIDFLEQCGLDVIVYAT